jgi:hypothetical protein
MHCPECRSPLREPYGFYATFISGRLRYSRSLRCTACNFAVEEDGSGVAPAEIRAEILARTHTWGIRGAESNAITRAIAAALNRNVVDIHRKLTRFDGIVAIGLKAEAEWIASKLVNVEVVRVEVADGICALGEGP